VDLWCLFRFIKKDCFAGDLVTLAKILIRTYGVAGEEKRNGKAYAQSVLEEAHKQEQLLFCDSHLTLRNKIREAKKKWTAYKAEEVRLRTKLALSKPKEISSGGAGGTQQEHEDWENRRDGAVCELQESIFNDYASYCAFEAVWGKHSLGPLTDDVEKLPKKKQKVSQKDTFYSSLTEMSNLLARSLEQHSSQSLERPTPQLHAIAQIDNPPAIAGAAARFDTSLPPMAFVSRVLEIGDSDRRFPVFGDFFTTNFIETTKDLILLTPKQISDLKPGLANILQQGIEALRQTPTRGRAISNLFARS